MPHHDPDTEIALAGGNENTVVRVGNTVRRPLHAWTPAVHALLRHLEQMGFDGAPRVLGIDDQDREILTFLPGEVGNYPMTLAMQSEGALVAAAVLLRRYHQAATIQPGWADLPWRTRHPDPTTWEVICHGDVAPYNLAYQGEAPIGLIDFDVAGPGPRIWDIAYAAYRLVPLASDASCRAFGFPELPDRPGRLARFVKAYGLNDATGLLETAAVRIAALRDDILTRAAAGDPSVEIHLREDHVGAYNSDLDWLAANTAELRAALGFLA